VNPRSLTTNLQETISITLDTKFTINVSVTVIPGAAVAEVAATPLSMQAEPRLRSVTRSAPLAADTDGLDDEQSGSLRLDVGTPDTPGWLLVSADRSTTPATLTVLVNPGQFSPGTYQGRISISATGANTVNIDVTLMVSATICSRTFLGLKHQVQSASPLPVRQGKTLVRRHQGSPGWR